MKINEMQKTASLENTDLIVTEKTEGTKAITFENLAAEVKRKNGKEVEIVDTLEITEHGKVPEGYLVSKQFANVDAAIKASYFYDGKEIQLSWAELEARRSAGNFEGLEVGDYKDITLSNGEKVRMEIAGINTYKNPHRTGGANVIHFISRDCLATTYRMNASNTNTGGFPASELKTRLNGEIYNMLPADVKAVIKAHKRLCSTKGSWAWQEDQKLWLPSEAEVWGFPVWSEVGYGGGNGVQFPIFKNSLCHINKGQGFGKAATGSTVAWWCESPLAAHTTTFCSVNNLGNATNGNASTALGVPLCFDL